jgi:O-antigen/teichoic acid export membrane protein
VGPTKIYVWAGVFVFLGVASGKYLIAENYTKITFVRTFFGMIVNVVLNLILIPKYGIKGAAMATLISYFVSVFFMVLIPKVFKNSILMIKAIMFFPLIKRLIFNIRKI